MLDTWESEHQILISQLEEQEKLALQTKVKILEERYQEMLKSRKVVHDMKNHILALKNYDQEQNWSGLHEYLNELSDDMLEFSYLDWKSYAGYDLKPKGKGCTESKYCYAD